MNGGGGSIQLIAEVEEASRIMAYGGIGEGALASIQWYESIFIGWDWCEASDQGLGVLVATVIEGIVNALL
jgi:hypothetical protein